MKRGTIVTVVIAGAYGKPRPALIVQSDLFQDNPSVTILPITTEIREAPLFRIVVTPSSTNGLLQPSQIMVDKIQTIPIEKAGTVMGSLDDAQLMAVNRSMALFLGFAG